MSQAGAKAEVHELKQSLKQKLRSNTIKITNHIYQHRAKYTALVTVPTTAIVMNNHYKPYVETVKVMALFIHDHGLGQRFLDAAQSVNNVAKNS